MYLLSVENVITLGKLIGLLLLFCPLPLLSNFENTKSTRNELALPVMGTIFLVYLRVYCYYEIILKKAFTKITAYCNNSQNTFTKITAYLLQELRNCSHKTFTKITKS